MESSAVTTTATENTTVQQHVSVEQLLATAETQYQSVQQQLTDLKKTLVALRKVASKSGKKSAVAKKPKVENPRTVSVKLAEFMKLDKANPLATRTQATKAISSYTKEHGLQEGKNFKVDSVLAGLLGLEVGAVRSYISINGSLSQHFPK